MALLLGFQRRYLSILLPKLDIVAVHELLCGFNCRSVVGAIEVYGVPEMAVPADDVGSIIAHVLHPTTRDARSRIAKKQVCLSGSGPNSN